MNAVLACYQQQIDTLETSELAWLETLRAQAQADFMRLGFPTRYDEDWKYTKLDALLQHAFLRNTGASVSSIACPSNAAALCLNGMMIEPVETNQYWPRGVIVCPLDKAFRQHAAIIQPYLNQLLPHQHGFQALNTAMLHTGVFIYISRGVKLEQPLLLLHQHNQDGYAVHIRHLIVAEPESSLTVIEDYQSDTDCQYLTNTVTEIALAAGAELNHYKIQRESRRAFHIGHLAVKQERDSQFTSHQFSFGSQLARSDISLTLREPKAKCLLNGIYVPKDTQHFDHHTRVVHQAPDCDSEQDYKGVLLDRSRAVFNGIIDVAPHAQHTRSKQHNKNLLLSEHAEINTKPQLEIFADDVVCTHGATVGQLDDDALFYMATRGIERQQALDYLIQAFAADNLRYIHDESLALRMKVLLNEQLGDLK